MRLRLLFAAAFLIISSFALSDADQFENPRVQWMKGKYGIMVHWLYPYFGGDVDEIVGGFNIDTFMSDFESSGAEWLIFTAGQNTGAYCSPNKALEMYCGESHTPKKRDLLLEVASRVKSLGSVLSFIFRAKSVEIKAFARTWRGLTVAPILKPNFRSVGWKFCASGL